MARVWLGFAGAVVIAAVYIEFRLAALSSDSLRARAVPDIKYRPLESQGRPGLNVQASPAVGALRQRPRKGSSNRVDAGASESGVIANGLPGEREGLSEELANADEAVFLQKLDDRVQTEPIDPRWRFETEQGLEAALNALAKEGDPMEGVQHEIMCASANCRLRLLHPGRALTGEIVMRLVDAAPMRQMEVHFAYEEGATTLYGTDQGRTAEMGYPTAE